MPRRCTCGQQNGFHVLCSEGMNITYQKFIIPAMRHVRSLSREIYFYNICFFSQGRVGGLIQAIKKAGDDKVLGYMCSIIVIKTSTKGNENQTCLNSFKSKILKIFLISFFFSFSFRKAAPFWTFRLMIPQMRARPCIRYLLFDYLCDTIYGSMS